MSVVSRLEIWTDVNGMFTADPRFVSTARLIRSLTYREAQVSHNGTAQFILPLYNVHFVTSRSSQLWVPRCCIL